MPLAIALGLLVSYVVFKTLFWYAIGAGVVLGILRAAFQRATGLISKA